jgi:hypothetical protein
MLAWGMVSRSPPTVGFNHSTESISKIQEETEESSIEEI